MYHSKKFALLTGLLLCAAAATARANTIVTFSVDMSTQIAGATFTPGTDTVAVRGTFDGWSAGGLSLVQQGSSAVYTNTVDNATDANGTVMQYIFLLNNGATYEATADFHNRAALMPATSGSSLALATPFFSDAGSQITSPVTFQVDMSQQINLGAFTNGSSIVEVRGNFNGWAGLVGNLTRDPTIIRTSPGGLLTSNVYTGTFVVTASTNAAMDYKFVENNGYEGTPTLHNSGDNRFFTHKLAQTFPIVFFSDAPFAPIAQVSFNVDMSAVLLSDPNYNPATVTLNGSFNGWSAGVLCTNNPLAPNTNIYTGVVAIGAGTTVAYQFRYNNGGTVYDNAPGGGNRSYTVPNVASTNLPVIFFNNVLVSDLLNMDTLVTFSVNMTNAVGAVGSVDQHVWNGGADTVYINGDFTGWQPWNPIGLTGLNCTNNPPGSEVYSYTTTFLKHRARNVKYKYGINGADDEALSGQDHFRYIRSTNGFYQMPLDKFGTQYVEPRFGNLTIGARSGNIIPVTWLGYPGVHLQTRSSLTSGTWQDQNGTDSQSSTNWPVGGGVQFFRLVQP